MTKYLAIIFVLIILVSCGKTQNEEIDEAVLSANIYLNTRQCQKAIDALDKIDYQDRDATYLQVRASAYACKSDFSEPDFFADDLPGFDGADGLGGLAAFSTSSSMDEPENDQYDYLMDAINILLYAGEIPLEKNPTVLRRASRFAADQAADINAQLMYMLMAEMGKYFYYYGNTDASGVKGAGSGDNTCFYDYNMAQDITYDITLGAGVPNYQPLHVSDFLSLGLTGSCDSTPNKGHESLNLHTSKRMCQGVVLINNFFDVMPVVVDAIGLDDFTAIADAQAIFNKYLDALQSPDISSVRSVQSQTKCESENLTPFTLLQLYFVFVVETLVK